MRWAAVNSTITSVPGMRVGHWTDGKAATGCTVLLCPTEGAVGGVEVRGAAPGTRETDLLRPGSLVQRVHAVLLSGGSAFGLDAATGVVRYLEERRIGYPAPAGPVPIVPAAILYDLNVGAKDVRPTADSGYQACLGASTDPVPQGSVGAGTGATVGKVKGMALATKGGIGSASLRLPADPPAAYAGGYTVGAIVAVNAFGDVRDPDSGELLAGPRHAEGGFLSTLELLLAGSAKPSPIAANTTIGVVATDAPLTKEQANRIAVMAHSGIARAVHPSYGMGDGDVLFILSTAPEGTTAKVNLTAVGAAAARSVELAIVSAILSANGLAGIPSATEWREAHP